VLIFSPNRCLYWFDNGQPGTSTLALASGIATGDSTLDYTRPAVYGNVLSDDCPSWSDYTCSIVAGTGTSTLSVIAAAPVRRSMSSEDIASMKKRATRATRIKQKMPPHIPGTRGSKYVHSKSTSTASLQTFIAAAETLLITYIPSLLAAGKL
jgi:hypothetical protein